MDIISSFHRIFIWPISKFCYLQFHSLEFITEVLFPTRFLPAEEVLFGDVVPPTAEKPRSVRAILALLFFQNLCRWRLLIIRCWLPSMISSWPIKFHNFDLLNVLISGKLIMILNSEQARITAKAINTCQKFLAPENGNMLKPDTNLNLILPFKKVPVESVPAFPLATCLVLLGVIYNASF